MHLPTHAPKVFFNLLTSVHEAKWQEHHCPWGTCVTTRLSPGTLLLYMSSQSCKNLSKCQKVIPHTFSSMLPYFLAYFRFLLPASPLWLFFVFSLKRPWDVLYSALLRLSLGQLQAVQKCFDVCLSTPFLLMVYHGDVPFACVSVSLVTLWLGMCSTLQKGEEIHSVHLSPVVERIFCCVLLFARKPVHRCWAV